MDERFGRECRIVQESGNVERQPLIGLQVYKKYMVNGSTGNWGPIAWMSPVGCVHVRSCIQERDRVRPAERSPKVIYSTSV
jgi:hypothetical protein